MMSRSRVARLPPCRTSWPDLIGPSFQFSSSDRVGAVITPRRRWRNVSVQQVCGKPAAISFLRWTIAPRTGRLDHDERAGGGDEAALAVKLSCVALRRDQLQARRAARFSVRQAEWRRHGAFAADGGVGVTFQYTPRAAHAEATAPRAGAAA